MVARFIFLALILCSCGKKGTVDPAFQEYVQDFEINIGVKVTGVDIYFKAQKAPILGVCISGGSIAKIEIDPEQWQKMGPYGKEHLIYHELGHCVLGRKHDDRLLAYNSGYIEGSIMNTYWFGDSWYYLKYRQQYKMGLKNNDVMQK